MVNDAWADDAAKRGWPACRFFGVFDGHAGDAAAELASVVLWAELKRRLVELLCAATPPSVPSHDVLTRVLKESFAATDARILDSAGHCGTTATTALLLGDTLCLANLGDSRTVLCRSERCFWSSADHKPEEPYERARIVAAGGHVATPRAAGQINVPRLNGVLSVSRAFGDAAFKAAGGTSQLPPLSAEPDVTFRQLNPRFDEFLLCVSDGVTDFYTDAAAVEIARGVLLRKSEPPKSVHERAQAACDRLVRAVTHSGHNADNVTIVMAMLCDDPAAPFGAA